MSEKPIYDDPDTKPELYTLVTDQWRSLKVQDRKELAKKIKERVLNRLQDDFPVDYESCTKGKLVMGSLLPWPPSQAANAQYNPQSNWINLLPCDVLEAAFVAKYVLGQPEARVAVVNPADPRGKDSWHANGDTSIEASLQMRSMLDCALQPQWYQPQRLHPDSFTYSPRVRVFGLEPGEILPDNRHFHVHFISAAPQVKPEVEWKEVNGEKDMSYQHTTTRDQVRHKLQTILKLACLKKISALVFPPFGCESKFGHPSQVISTLLRDELVGANGQPPAIDWRHHGLKHVFIAFHNRDPKGKYDQPEALWQQFVKTFSGVPGVYIDKSNESYLDAILKFAES